MKFNLDKSDIRKIGVYCIENNINGKIYIGSTSTNFRHRYLQYKSAFKKGLHNQPVLYRAFRKYGFENFTFNLICICAKEDCIKMEQFYIDKGVDYNSCLIAGSLLGLKHSKNSKTRTLIKGNHHSAVKVDKYSKKGVFIKSYNSIIEACDENNIKSKSNIVQACKGNVFSAGGFRWSYKDKKLIKRPNRKGKCKVSITKNDFYKEFNSLTECSEYLVSIGYEKCNQGLISSTLKRNGFIYKYKINRL